MNKWKGIICAAILCMPMVSQAQEPEPLARIGSHWNYWVAQEYSYGYVRYKVVKDTVITAKMYETGETLTATASLINKYSNLTYHTQTTGQENVLLGQFAAIRKGNASYVYDLRVKRWFKWIDMNAKPGDKWVMSEIITGKGVYDYVEVSFRDTLDIGGKQLPCIYLIPSCTSRFTTDKDFTSRISMSGYFNIDFWSPYSSPEPKANGVVYTQELREINVGMLCADVNGEALTTDKLAEYVEGNNKPLYDRGVIDCDSLHAPMRDPTAESRQAVPIRPTVLHNTVAQSFYTEGNGNFDVNMTSAATASRQAAAAIADDETVTIPVVVHVVHNPATPEEKVSKEQIDNLIAALNNAYGTTHTDQVREPFKDVVGCPNVNFVLASKAPDGSTTDGVVYHETDQDYYPSSGSVANKYAYKYEADGSPRNWDHTRYANIYVVDMGGFDQKGNVGGFVTNPEPTSSETWALQKEWYKSGDFTFWQNWLASAEGAQLDGLVVDTWYTFGGKSAINPYASYATAIHELGHYLGLRHPAIQVVQNSDGSIETFDDGFSDTPSTHFNQYAYVPCNQDIYQCGELVQVENYMDYCLECACMFTRQQSAFMRQFVAGVRPAFTATGIASPLSGNEQAVSVSRTPHGTSIMISGSYAQASVYDVTGNLVCSAINQPTISLPASLHGIYIIKIKTLGHGGDIIKKVMM